MSNEVYAFALKSALDEIQNSCPDVCSIFVFKDGKLSAKNENTAEENAIQTITAFDKITEKADAIGDIEAITIQTDKGKISVSATNAFYLTTVSSKGADEKYVNTLTRILIPIVIKLAEKIQPASFPSNETILPDQPEPEPEEDTADETTDEAETEEIEETEDNENNLPDYNYEEETATEPEEQMEQTEPEIDDEPLLPEPPVTQLIVENLGGLLIPSDTVRVDQQVINEWNELFGDTINEVEIETLNGKTIRCKFKNIKKSKDSGKGIIKMPEKIQLTLKTQKGELVTVKPVIE